MEQQLGGLGARQCAFGVAGASVELQRLGNPLDFLSGCNSGARASNPEGALVRALSQLPLHQPAVALSLSSSSST